jgi:UDP-N-acetylmuramoyl-tripeptide--D-alanyl-D-alanine ligase
MTKLFTVGEILDATGGEGRGLTADGVRSVSIDSREISADALFVAIKGDRFDGHDFVAQALESGAVAAMVSRDRAAELGDRLIVVADPLQGLIDLAKAARERSRGAIVAVTGSAGKTTTKEAIRSVLAAAGETHAAIRSFNNHWGVPLTLARLPRTAQFGVFEIGMNHAGEITPLTKLVRPHVAVVTTVAAAHLEFFKSVADIARAKAEIFLGLESGGTALINGDHEHVGILVDAARAAGANIVTYGFGENCDWRLVDIEVLAGGMSAGIVHGGDRFDLVMQVSGRHMLANAVAALAVGVTLGVEPAVALKALAEFTAPEGRGQAIRLGPNDKPLLLIDESYNANSASMRAALEVFAGTEAPSGRKVLVLGDMLELGDESQALHRALKDAVLESGADVVFLVGPSMAALADALPSQGVAAHAQSVDDIAETVVDQLAPGDAIMIKGSNGMRLSKLVKTIRERFA